MPSLHHLQRRREQFLDSIDHPALLLAGGWQSRNYPQNTIPYRADSSILFFLSDPEPDSALFFDPADRSVTLFLHERTTEDALWHGTAPSFEAMGDLHGVTHVEAVETLKDRVLARANGRRISSLAVVDRNATQLASEITGQNLDFYDAANIGQPELVAILGTLRRSKEEEEIAEMRKTAEVTAQAHTAAMRHSKPGVSEQLLAGIVDGTFARHGCVPAYGSILSVRGEVLHNHAHDNLLARGDIVLLDAGAENRSGYCSDVTRCWPADGSFSPEASEIYDIVLRAETEAIDIVRPGVRYRDLHMTSSRVIAEGLTGMGLLRGSVDSILESGAHAVFFPHGVGHLIGLDVHDMEGFGDQVAYAPERSRSDQFGTGYLRLDLDLEPGMSFTIEPGIYFVPAILHSDSFRQRFADQVDFERAERFLEMNDGRGFGGIRIEDDVVCTAEGHEVLTASTPKAREEVTVLVGAAI